MDGIAHLEIVLQVVKMSWGLVSRMSGDTVFGRVLQVVKTMSHNSGMSTHPLVELMIVSPDPSHERVWYSLRFPVIKTLSGRKVDYEYFTLGYHNDSVHTNVWWYIFSGYAGSCFSHPFIKNPHHDDAFLPNFGCVLIPDITKFLTYDIHNLLTNYTLTTPLNVDEYFTI